MFQKLNTADSLSMKCHPFTIRTVHVVQLYLPLFYFAELCMCQVRGDPHYKQWDKGMVHFQGSCTYVLMHAGEGDCEWLVLGTNRRRSPRAKVSVLVKITIIIRFMKIEIEIVIYQGRKITVSESGLRGCIEDNLTIFFLFLIFPTVQKFSNLMSANSKVIVRNLSKFIYFANLRRN